MKNWYFLILVVFFSLFSFVSVISTDLYLESGVCYSDPNITFNLCCEHPEQDLNYTFNLTCPEYNFSTYFANVEDYLFEIANISHDLKDDVETFNLTKQYADVYSNWKSCTKEFSFYYNESKLVPSLTNDNISCHNLKGICDRDLQICTTNNLDLSSQRWTYGVIGAIIGAVASYAIARQTVPKRSNLEQRRGSGIGINKEALKKALGRDEDAV